MDEKWQERLETSYQALERFILEGYKHIAFYYGEQNVEVASLNRDLKLHWFKQENDVKVQSNYFTMYINRIRSRIVGGYPYPSVTALSDQDRQAVEAARFMEKILMYLHQELGIKRKSNLASLLQVLVGLVAFKVYWDDKAYVSVEGGRKEQLGNPRVEVVSGTDLRWDCAVDDIRESDWIMHVQLLSPMFVKWKYGLSKERIKSLSRKRVGDFAYSEFYGKMYGYSLDDEVVEVIECHERVEGRWKIETFIGGERIGGVQWSDIDVFIPFYYDKVNLSIPATIAKDQAYIQEQLNEIISKAFVVLTTRMITPLLKPVGSMTSVLALSGDPSEQVEYYPERGEPHFMAPPVIPPQSIQLYSLIKETLMDISAIQILPSNFPKSASSGELGRLLQGIEISTLQVPNDEFNDAMSKLYITLAELVRSKYDGKRLITIGRGGSTESFIFQRTNIMGNYVVSARPMSPPLGVGEQMALMLELYKMGAFEPDKQLATQKLFEILDWGKHTIDVNPEKTERRLQAEEFEDLKRGISVDVKHWHNHGAHIEELKLQCALLGRGFDQLPLEAQEAITAHWQKHIIALAGEIILRAQLATIGQYAIQQFQSGSGEAIAQSGLPPEQIQMLVAQALQGVKQGSPIGVLPEQIQASLQASQRRGGGLKTNSGVITETPPVM